MSETSQKKRTGAGQYALLLALILLGVGGVAAYGFYQEEITAYVRLEGWNLGSATRASGDFLAAAAAADGERVAPMLFDEQNPDLKAVRENGKLVALIIPDYGGPKTRRLKEIAPNAEPKFGEPQMVTQAGGAVVVPATFPNHELQLRWDRVAGAWKLKAIGWTDFVR